VIFVMTPWPVTSEYSPDSLTTTDPISSAWRLSADAESRPTAYH
jgi:hypothetical protein